MNPLAANLSSASRPTSATAQPVVRNAADAQATLANRLAERLGLEPGALAGKANDYTPEKVAGRILGFIEQRLQSEQAAGADPSKLKGLLEQARSGVEKGFAEARKILDGMGVLQGKVATTPTRKSRTVSATWINALIRMRPWLRAQPISPLTASGLPRKRKPSIWK